MKGVPVINHEKAASVSSCEVEMKINAGRSKFNSVTSKLS